jgi:3-hydroxyisobutyrate dehydrogenase
MSKIAFFGLGNMGASMALNLVKARHQLTVFDLVDEQMNALVKAGAEKASNPASAVNSAEIVISMLPAGKHVLALYQALIDAADPNTLFIDCSTIEASEAKQLHCMLSEAGHRFIDAPVSGGIAGAAAGSLTFIIGGDSEDVNAAQPVLQNMGQHCFHAGDVGAGQIAKICNNMLLAVLMAGTSEALKMAMDNGLDPKVMSEIMKQSSGNNWTLQKYNPVPNVMDNVPSSNKYQGGFMVELMNKDLQLAINTAGASQSAVPMGNLAKSLYQLHALQGNQKKDFSSIFESFLQK